MQSANSTLTKSTENISTQLMDEELFKQLIKHALVDDIDRGKTSDELFFKILSRLEHS